jgi:hypothetical protein
MTASPLQRAAGLGLSIGAMLFVAHIALRSVVTAGIDPAVFATGSAWVPINALGLAGAVLLVLSLPVVYTHLAGPCGWVGSIGMALMALAWLFFGVFLSLYAMLILPWLAEVAPSLVSGAAPPPPAVVPAFLASLMAWLVGTVLFGVPFMRGRVEPRWVGYLLPLSAVWMFVGSLVIAPRGPASSLPINLLSNLGPVLLASVLGYLGFETWSNATVNERRAPDILNDFALDRRRDAVPLSRREK